MTDSILTILAAVCLTVAFTSALLVHTRQDDARRADLEDCVNGWEASAELNRAALAVADQCHDLLLGGACTCWLPDEVTR